MAIYLYNLGFSLGDAANGNFQTNTGSPFTSDAWYQYNQPGVPSWANQNTITSPGQLTPSQWTSCAQPTSFVAGTDYLVLRIFNNDVSAPAILLRLTAVFGRGSSATLPPSGTNLQAPLMLSASRARTVIDCDNTANPPNWPSPTSVDSGFQAWTYCVGMIQGAVNEYSCNVGASVYVGSGQYYGLSSFGHDPQIKVGATMGGKRHHETAA